MSHECHEGSCSSQSHTHGHQCCSGHQGPTSCSSQHECCGSECHHQHKYCDELLELADQAWMEVVKKEIIKEIETQAGEHIKKLAKLVAETNRARWMSKIDEKKHQEDYEQKFREIMFRNDKK